MSDEPNNLEYRLRELHKRLDRIERSLGLQETSSPPKTQEQPPRPAPPVASPPPAPRAHATIEPPPLLEEAADEPSRLKSIQQNIRKTSQHLPAAEGTDSDRGPLEILIAAKWFAWIGAIIVVLGAAFALREFGADLWYRLTPITQSLIVAAFGGVLLISGELTLRRFGRLASVGLFSAGLGVLYLDAYATFQFFNPPIVSREWSFALMAVVALVGFGLTLRTAFRTIGILSLIAGYATPVLLSSIGGHELELLTFFTVLLGIALALSAAVPRQYRVLRYVALALHIVVAGGWILVNGRNHWLLSLLFMNIWWFMVLTEATLAAMRRQSGLGNPTAVLLATACHVTAGTFILNGAVPGGVDWLGLFTAGIGIISAATALQFGPGIDGLRQRPQFAIDKLAMALWTQAGVLIIVAVAMQFDGYGRSVAWLAMAAAAIELGNRLRSRGLDIFGIVVGSLAIVMVATIDAFFSPTLGKDIWTFSALRFDVRVDRWSLLCLGAIVVTQYAAQRLRASAADGWTAMPVLIAVVGTVYWIGLCIARADGLAVTVGVVIGAVFLLLLDPINRNVRANSIATGAVLLAAAWWIGGDVIAYRGEWTHNWPGIDSTPILNAQCAIGVLIAGVLLVAYILRARRKAAPSTTNAPIDLPEYQPAVSRTAFLPVAAMLVLLVDGAAEIERGLSIAQRSMTAELLWPDVLWRIFWITMFFAPAALVMVIIGIRRNLRLMMTTGVTLLWSASLLWLSYGTLGQLGAHGIADVTVFVNEQFGAGVACLAASVIAGLFMLGASQLSRNDLETAQHRSDRRSAAATIALAGAIGLWLGSFEIARVFHPDRMATQMGLSVYWGVFAVALVIFGFLRHVPVARYVGLALLGVTAVKVLTIDLATVEKIWRVVSLLVTGLLAIGVSIGYARVAPKLDTSRTKNRPQV